MKMYKKIIVLTVMLFGMTGWAGDSAPFLLDTTDPLVETGGEVPCSYNSWVGGNSSVEVVIMADGTEIKRTTGEGEFVWAPTTVGKHTLTYTTYINGVAQDEVYEATVYSGWKYTINNYKATLVETTQTSENIVIPSEIDGYPVGGIANSVFANCTSITIPVNVIDVVANVLSDCSSLKEVIVLGGGNEFYVESLSKLKTLLSRCSALEHLSLPVSISYNYTIDLKHCKNLKAVTMEYAGVDANTLATVSIDDELLLSSVEHGMYTWVPHSDGVHELRCETGSKTLAILVDTDVEDENLPNPPGVKDETLSLSVERKEFTNSKRAAGTFSVTSTTGSGTWSASASEDWISLTKTSGSVSDKVSYIVQANASAQARTGYVYVSGHVHMVVQPGTGVTVSPSSLNIGHQGVTQSIAVDTVVDGASWTARSESQWISVTPVSGSGDSNVNIQVAPYYVVGTREGAVTIAGETVSVFQRGRDMELIDYSTNCTSAAQSVLVDVSAISDVTWSVVSGADWITVSHAGSGLGSSTVDLALAENTSYLPRTGTVAIGTETFTVTQAGVSSPSFSIAASTVSVPATATSAKTLKITATPDLPWKITSNCNWLAPLNNYKTGSGSKTIAYSVAANPNLSSRSGKLTFTPDASSGLQAKTLTVTQAAAVSSIDSTGTSVSAAATTVSVSVTVDSVVNWSVSSSVGWVTIEGAGSRIGAGTVVLRISENTSLTPRNGTVTIAGHTYTIRQAGGTIGISSSTSSVTSNGGTLYINVTGSANLNWSIQNAADWVTIEGDASHTGPATLVIRVEANTGTEDRKCEIVIGGQKLTIEQAAAGTSVDEDVFVYGEDVEIGLFSVEAPDYLTWETFTEDDDWIIVTSDSPTTGSGEVEYIVDSVDSGTSRIGIIWVGNTPVYICQSSFSVELSETAKEVSRLSGIGQIAVEAGDGNQWHAVSTAPWIRLIKDQGEGDGFVSFEYDENTTGVERVGRIIIVDKVFTLVQTDVDPSVSRWTISYENLKGASNPNPSKYEEGSSLTFLPLPNVTGYTFAGWTPSSIKASDTGNKTVRANWTTNTYTVKFDANGGNGQMADQSMTYDSKTALRANAFTRTGYAFAGWRLEASGSVAYADRAQVSNLTGAPNGVVTLYAAWTTRSYNIRYEETKGATNSNPANYTIEDAVTFSPLANLPGYTFVGWTPASIPVGTTGDIVVTAQWRREWNLDGLVSIGIAQITKGGSANWYEQSGVTHNGEKAWRSGDIDDSETSWMEIQIDNATGFSFWWKVSSEQNYDKLSWWLDGVEQELISGVTDWVKVTRQIASGKHTIRFQYKKDSSLSKNDDSGYVSGFSFTCPDTVSVTFDLNGKGTRSGGGDLHQVIEFGGTPVLPIVSPNVGWRFLGWPSIGNVFANTTLSANYEAIDYAISYQGVKGASNTNPTTYTVEDSITFAALGNIANYTFSGWTPSSIPVGSTGDKVVTANWEWTPQDAVVDASITGLKPVTVKADWAKTELEREFGAGKKEAFISKFGADLTSAMTKKTGKKDVDGNELLVWHDYVAGTDPTDINSTFKAIIDMQDGKPVISWEPNLNSDGEERVYTVHGKKTLSDIWHSPITALDHFFKVDVAMPREGTVTFNAGGGSSVSPVSIRVGQPIGELPTPTRDGYKFLGWFTASEGGNAVTPEMVVSADMTIYARWERDVAADLVHRWSFNGDLTDSVGGQTATAVGNVTTDGVRYKTLGGSSGSAYIDLGNNILPNDGSPVTVEMWVRQDAYLRYGRIYCWGAMPREGIFTGNNGSRENAEDCIQMRWDGVCGVGFGKENTLGSFSVGVEYYVATIFEPLENDGWKVTFYKKDVTTGATLSSSSIITDTEWKLQDFQQKDMVLGQTLTSWDDCSKNSYNELRIWKKSMTEAELTASAIAGPDANLGGNADPGADSENADTREKVQLWENGPYWATTNIGAENPEDYGCYFWWGDTVGYKRENDKWVASDGSNSDFSFEEDNTPTYDKDISTLKSEGWITTDGVLAPVHDAATVHWGDNWRMPTKDELSALNNNCDWTWTTLNGVNGYVVKGRGTYASKSIFLPVAGFGNGTSLGYAGSYGIYWSSVPSSDSSNSWNLYFISGYHSTGSGYRRYNGQSVRPVLGFSK